MLETTERRDGVNGLRANATRDGFFDPNVTYHDFVDSYITYTEEAEAAALAAAEAE